MKRHTLAVLVGALLIGAAAMMPAHRSDSAARPTYHSAAAVALSPDGKLLYAADQTADAVVVIDTGSNAVAGTIKIADPRSVVLSPDGKSLFVSSGNFDKVFVIDTASKSTRATFDVGRQPVGLALSPDAKTLFCCNQFTDDVSVIDLAKKGKQTRVRVVREPRYAAVGQGGKTLVVANQIPVGSNLDEGLGAEVSLIDIASGGVSNIKLSRGATFVGQVCCSPDGKFAYVPHVLARWLVPPTQLERGWVSTNALTIIDVENKKRVNTVLLDDLDRGAANPWGIAISKKGDTLFVTHAGVNEVQIIDTAKLHKLVNEWPADSQVALEDDLTAVYRAGVRQRVPCGGINPRAAAAGDNALFVANYFSGTVTRLDPATGKVQQTIALGKQPEADAARRGEQTFFDGTICFQHWMSCSSCHPGGRTDGLAWDLLNDGIGNPKNTKSLLYSGKVGPVMASGIRSSMRVAVVAGFKFIEFHVPTDAEIDQTEVYINSMQPVRSPLRKPDGSLSPAAQRGKAIFERADVGCSSCHPGPLFTDMKPHAVGTRQSFDERDDYYTATLVEMFRTSPYLHAGDATTMHEVLREKNKDDKHGKTSQLSEKELHDLAEYVLSL